MNPLSWFNSAESTLRTCELVSMFAGVVTAAALIGQILAARVVNGKQAVKIAELDLKRVELEKKIAPRQLNREAFWKIIGKIDPPTGTVEIMYSRDDPECFDLAQQILRALKDAGWNATEPVPIPPITAEQFLKSPTAMSVGGQPSGVTVVAHSISDSESKASWDRELGKEWEKTPWTVLFAAIGDSIGAVGGSGGGPYRPPEDTLRVVVAPRM